MSFTSLLIDTCTTQRFTEGAAGDWGTPVRTWADYLTDQLCRLMSGYASSGGVSSSGFETRVGAAVVIADYTLFISDVDITEQDRVVIDGVTYNVVIVTDRQDGSGVHHKECGLLAVR